MKRVTREGLLAVLIGGSAVIANCWHIIRSYRPEPAGGLFTGIAHSFSDYFLYVSAIAQGQHGAWIYTQHLFTNEQVPATWIYWFYTLVGKLPFSPFVSYTISLAVLAATLLFLVWQIAGRVFPGSPARRLLVLLFFASASHIPGLGDFWFSPMPALNRLGGVPHQILQTILILSTLYLASLPALRIPALIAVSFLAATANPIQMLLLICALFVTYALHVRNGGNAQTHIVRFIAVSLPSLLGAVLTNTEFTGNPILRAAQIWEDGQRFRIDVTTFLFSFGPVLIPVLPALYKRIWTGSPLRMATLLYGFLSFAVFLSPLPAILGTSPVRWLSPAAYLAIPVCAAYGAGMIPGAVSGRLGVPVRIVSAALIVLYLVSTAPSLLYQIRLRTEPLQTQTYLTDLNHVHPDIVSALETTGRLPGGITVLTDPTLPYDVLVPVYGKKSLTGHPIHTLYPAVKENLRQEFFGGAMDESRARAFFSDHGIGAVIMSPAAARVLPAYPFLGMLLTNDRATVYVVGR